MTKKSTNPACSPVQRENRHFKKYLLLALVLIVAALMIGVFVKWRTAIKAALVYYSSADSSLPQIEENRQLLEEKLGVVIPVTETNFDDVINSGIPAEKLETPSQQEQENGKQSSSDGENAAMEQENVTGSNKPETGGETKTESSAQEIIQRYVDELSTVEAKFKNQLADIISETRKEYWHMSKDEQTQANKVALVKTKLTELANMETSCDAEVNALIAAMEKELADINVSAVDAKRSILKYYEDMKSIMIAACYDELNSSNKDG